MTMNIATEAHIAGKPITEKPKARPVRMVRWFIIVGLLLALLVVGQAGVLRSTLAGLIVLPLLTARTPCSVCRTGTERLNTVT